MRARILAEEVLLLMEYGLDFWTRPTLNKWDESFEGWLYRNGLLRRLQWLETQKYLLREGRRSQWVFRLTEKGRQAAAGATNPAARWERWWDGWWRLLVFDLPVEQRTARQSLLRWLREHRFGYLQDSVWITPDPVTEMARALDGFRDDAASFTLLESRCVKGFSNAALVHAGWPFEDIHRRYEAYLEFAHEAVKESAAARWHPQRLFEVLREERRQWRMVLERDPLLPRALWPRNYLGPKASRVRDQLRRAIVAQVNRACGDRHS